MPALLSFLLVAALLSTTTEETVPTENVRLLVPEGTSIEVADETFELTTTPSKGETGWQRVEMETSTTAEEAAAQLSDELGVEVVVENRYDLLAPADEPGFTEQWYHHNTGQTGGRPDADIDSPTAWPRSLGEGVVVAVIDSGIDLAHPDLASRIWANPDPVGGGDQDGNGFLDDYRGWDFIDEDNNPSPVGSGSSAVHGTAVAGLIAAAVNGEGITGVAPSAKIMALRACDSSGCWSLPASEAIRYAATMGADIINLSFGGIVEEDPLLSEAVAFARSRDVLVVAAAGNEGRNLDNLPSSQQFIPAGLPFSNVVAVGATSHTDNLASFSNYGSAMVDIAAPGDDTVTTGLSSIDPYILVSGTSFSAPVVAGSAALLLSSDPGIGHQEMAARLEAFVDRPNGLGSLVGSGRLNVGRTLTVRFTDTGSSVFVDAIDWLAAANITQGCNPPHNTRYCPVDQVTRGEMAVFLSRAFGLPSSGTDYFDDDDGTFFEASANRLAAAGLTVGCGSRRYCGASPIRRGEMAAMLARALALPPATTDHFVDDNDSMFEGAIDKIATAGITLGCNPPANTRYCPNDQVTRGQMSAFIKRSAEHSSS